MENPRRKWHEQHEIFILFVDLQHWTIIVLFWCLQIRFWHLLLNRAASLSLPLSFHLPLSVFVFFLRTCKTSGAKNISCTEKYVFYFSRHWNAWTGFVIFTISSFLSPSNHVICGKTKWRSITEWVFVIVSLLLPMRGWYF